MLPAFFAFGRWAGSVNELDRPFCELEGTPPSPRDVLLENAAAEA
jgi:hypothetical protein